MKTLLLVSLLVSGCAHTATHARREAPTTPGRDEVRQAQESYYLCMDAKTAQYVDSKEPAVAIAYAAQGGCSSEFTRFEQTYIDHLQSVVSGRSRERAYYEAKDQVQEIKLKTQERVVSNVVEFRSKGGH